MKHFAKTLYYKARTFSLPKTASLNLGYVIHTEKIFDKKIFDTLISFCKQYHSITGKKVICTLMTGANPRIQDGMKKHGISDKEYAARAHTLSEVSTLGYHGHFWTSRKLFESPNAEMKGTHFVLEPFIEQFSNDLEWFNQYQLNHHHCYAAGWWFMHPEVLNTLIQNGFQYDFSFSYSPPFLNPYSHFVMTENCIETGKSFAVQSNGREIHCIQNLIGCHKSPFPQDFERVLGTILPPNPGEIFGAGNSHDFDLEPAFTFRCLEYLIKKGQTHFWEYTDLSAHSATKTIHLADTVNQMRH